MLRTTTILKMVILLTLLRVLIKLKSLSDSMRSTVTLIQATIIPMEQTVLGVDTAMLEMHTNIKTTQQISPLNSMVLPLSIMMPSTTTRASTLPRVNSTSEVNMIMSMDPMILASKSKTGGIISLRYHSTVWPPPVFLPRVPFQLGEILWITKSLPWKLSTRGQDTKVLNSPNTISKKVIKKSSLNLIPNKIKLKLNRPKRIKRNLPKRRKQPLLRPRNPRPKKKKVRKRQKRKLKDSFHQSSRRENKPQFKRLKPPKLLQNNNHSTNIKDLPARLLLSTSMVKSFQLET